jgi:hypothetical protein
MKVLSILTAQELLFLGRCSKNWRASAELSIDWSKGYFVLSDNKGNSIMVFPSNVVQAVIDNPTDK